MNTISEILKNQYSNQGIQDLSVFYDSYVFNLKIKNASQNYNFILIEKFSFDYISETIEREKNGILVNFGNTSSDIAFKSTGNCYLNSFLNSKNKTIFLVGLRTMTNGNSIPIIYNYDINQHVIKPVFPKTSDVDQFKSFDNHTFKTNSVPFVKYENSKIYVLFQTSNSSYNYINKLIFDASDNSADLESYEIFQYPKTFDIDFTNFNDTDLYYKYKNYHGILHKLISEEDNITGTVIALDDFIGLLSFDDNNTVLGLDV